MRLVTAAEIRECDRRTIEEVGLPGFALMESAGRGATQALLDALDARGQRVQGLRVGVFAGGGNNGGDGFVIARELLNRGAQVTTLLLAPRARVRGDAAIALQALERLIHQRLSPGLGALLPWGDALEEGEPLQPLLDSLGPLDVAVDALLGTGLDRPVRGPLLEIIAHLNALPPATFVLAVDLPSGLGSDDGQERGAAVQADLTVTFGAMRLGHWLYPGRARCGRTALIDIGIPPGVLERVGPRAHALTRPLCRDLLPPRQAAGHKGTFGHALLFGGDAGKAGALALAAAAALRAGAGLVTAAGHPAAGPVVTALHPEIMTAGALEDLLPIHLLHELLQGKDVLAAGPGLGQRPPPRALLHALLHETLQPLVLDADALNLAAQEPDPAATLARSALRRPVLLTPHPGEFARLTRQTVPDLLRDPVAAARGFAARSRCVVILKGACTVVAHPDGDVALNTTGNPGMATAGTGDLLTGLLAGLLAQRLDPWDAARLAVFLHGLAGDLAAEPPQHPRALVASDLLHQIGPAFRRCEAP